MVLRMNDKAVSPVIGVMLMLVVTIILAAAVSSYSGDLTSENEKASQMVIKAEFSQSSGMTITHMGGDTVNTLDTEIIVSPTKDFGSYDQLRWLVNSTVVKINKDGTVKSWNDPSAFSSKLARTFQPGEVAYVSQDDLGEVQPKTYTSGINDSTSGYYGFANTNALGQRIVLSLVDSSGKTIAKTEVVVQP